MTKERKNGCSWRLTPLSVIFLKLGLFGVALQAGTLAIVVHDTLPKDPARVRLYYAPLLEYIALSVMLIAIGVLLFEAMSRDLKK